ncbi:hypothetical protein PRIPAC_82131 [Pristionchus pacificus]|uniref:Uncharacterized protein n=1 Tax=Pristionchus pacificus TaxID=54126 RepID=A0A2A6BX89_PRIPA|nr:hypothetical protein PRIPAC_82131 [Pristionchus pacificus]|eukprot:PDM70488.1 hypothetical protein PRIPAC_46734 [Pristionchus pacificus]
MKFYPGSHTHLILAISVAEIFYETCFRRDVAWSQRNFFEQNQYVHRHQHPLEPRKTFFYCAGPLRICPILTQTASYDY